MVHQRRQGLERRFRFRGTRHSGGRRGEPPPRRTGQDHPGKQIFSPTTKSRSASAKSAARRTPDFVKTSTGFGFVKLANGDYNYKGATAPDLQLMRKHAPSHVQVKASGGIRNLDDLILARDLGATRCGTSATAALLGEYRRRESAGSTEAKTKSQSLGGGGLLKADTNPQTQSSDSRAAARDRRSASAHCGRARDVRSPDPKRTSAAGVWKCSTRITS